MHYIFVEKKFDVKRPELPVKNVPIRLIDIPEITKEIFIVSRFTSLK